MPTFPLFPVYPGQYRYDLPPNFQGQTAAQDTAINQTNTLYDIPLPVNTQSSLEDIKFQFSRLNPVIDFLKTIPLQSKAKLILFNNIQGLLAQIAAAQNVNVIIQHAEHLINAFYNFLDRDNPTLLTAILQRIRKQPQAFVAELPTLINTVIQGVNLTYNRATTTSDFDFNELFTIYSNFNLDKFPVIKTFLDEEKQSLPIDQQVSLDNAQAYAKSLPLPANAQEQLALFLVQKYGLNFPNAIKQYMFHTISRLNSNSIKTAVRIKLAQTPHDIVSMQYANQIFGPAFYRSTEAPPETLYDQDILSTGYTTIPGNLRRTFRNLPNQLLNLGSQTGTAGVQALKNAVPGLGSVVGTAGTIVALNNAGNYAADYLTDKLTQQTVDTFKDLTPTPLRGIFNNDLTNYAAKRKVQDTAASIYNAGTSTVNKAREFLPSFFSSSEQSPVDATSDLDEPETYADADEDIFFDPPQSPSEQQQPSYLQTATNYLTPVAALGVGAAAFPPMYNYFMRNVVLP